MKLTAENVRKVFEDCLFEEGEDTKTAVTVTGIMTKFDFEPNRLKNHKQDIIDLLADLPPEFHKTKGGGWSFLNACMTAENEHWGENQDIELLLALGLASEQVMILAPRELWSALPGGMPYFVVNI